MKKTPLKRKKETKAELGPQDADNDLREIEESLKQSQEKIDKWQKRLNEWWSYLDAAKKVSLEIPGKLPSIIFAMMLLSGCQTLPTLTHPRAGYGYYESTPYYNPPARPRSFYPEGYYEDVGISRNDFIIATEGGF